jgi:hypothetical protein
MALECERIDFLSFQSISSCVRKQKHCLPRLSTWTLGYNLEPCFPCSWYWVDPAPPHLCLPPLSPTSSQSAEAPSKPHCFFPGPLRCPSPHTQVSLSFLDSMCSLQNTLDELQGWIDHSSMLIKPWKGSLQTLKKMDSSTKVYKICSPEVSPTSAANSDSPKVTTHHLHVWEVSCCPLQSAKTPACGFPLSATSLPLAMGGWFPHPFISWFLPPGGSRGRGREGAGEGEEDGRGSDPFLSQFFFHDPSLITSLIFFSDLKHSTEFYKNHNLRLVSFP